MREKHIGGTVQGCPVQCRDLTELEGLSRDAGITL